MSKAIPIRISFSATCFSIVRVTRRLFKVYLYIVFVPLASWQFSFLIRAFNGNCQSWQTLSIGSIISIEKSILEPVEFGNISNKHFVRMLRFANASRHVTFQGDRLYPPVS